MLGDDGTADRKAEARAGRFGGAEWVEEARGDARGHPGAAVTDGYPHRSVVRPGSTHDDVTRFVRSLGKGFDGVAHEIEYDVLDLDSVDLQTRQPVAELEAVLHIVSLRIGSHQVGKFSDQHGDFGRLGPSGVLARQAAQLTDDVPGTHRLCRDLFQGAPYLFEIRIRPAQQPVAGLSILRNRRQRLGEFVGDPDAISPTVASRDTCHTRSCSRRACSSPWRFGVISWTNPTKHGGPRCATAPTDRNAGKTLPSFRRALTWRPFPIICGTRVATYRAS